MARSGAQAAALEKRALAAETKSDGMRMLFDAGYTVAQVKALFGVRYSFAYGVYVRNGGTGGTTPRAAKPKAASRPAKAAAKSTARPAARSKSTAKAPARTASARSKARAKA